MDGSWGAINQPLRVPTPPLWKVLVYVEYGPLTVTVTTRIITFLGSGIPINLYLPLLQ